jgi:CubicO group peptidase (beta-lactamase class C family)
MKNRKALSRLVVCLSLAGLSFPGVADDAASIDDGTFSEAMREAARMPRLHSLLVSHDGELVVEEYFNGTDPGRTANVKSVSKSILSALVGIAIAQGHVAGVDQPISDYYADRLTNAGDRGKGDITIGNLLSMQAGLETTSFYNYGAWVLSDDWVGFALDRPILSPPGTRMHYSTGNTHLLSDIITRATGKSTLEYARDELARPLGITLAAWPQDPGGVYFGGNNMELTPRQMLRFGELYLNNGRIGDTQVVPADWVAQSLEPRVRSSRNRERRYGYGWWLRDMAGVPTAYAWGYGGQFILVVRELRLVAVTTSSSLPGDTRRAHIRALYRLLEDKVVAPAAVAAATRASLPAGGFALRSTPGAR